MVKLVALITHQLGLGKVRKGERYEVSSETAAKLLVHRGLAKYADDNEPKRKYNRRDMVAQ